MSANDIPALQSWTRRWWRVPGESFLSGHPISTEIQINADFTWCHADEWGVRVEYSGGSRELVVIWTDGPDLANTDGLPTDVVRAMAEHLARRHPRPMEDRSTSPLLNAIASHFRARTWVSGRRLRRDVNLSLEDFDREAKRLMPRYVRKESTDDGDQYSLTLPGLLRVEPVLQGIDSVEKTYEAIAHRFGIDPDAMTFSADDLKAVGLVAPDLALVAKVAEVCLLLGSRDEDAGVFRMPADREAIATAVGKGMPFMGYLLHAATEGSRSEHYPVRRPWPSAPLWLERDGSQPDAVPMGLISISLKDVGPQPTARDVANDPGAPQVPGYVLVEPLPGGAGGEVYLARENRDGGLERVIKLFIPHPFADEQDPEPRFRSEVEAILRLQHKAIVRYVSSGVLDGPRPVFYLVMEFVKGSRLQTRAPSMPFDIRVAAMIEILDGLEHAHNNSVFHRDIKPSNIMIRESDNQPVLVDFGLAYLVGDELDDDRTRTPLGTPGYIPPEVSNAPKKSRDPRHDIYQAGVTLYVMLAGHLPDPYMPLETTDSSLRGLDAIVKRALADDPTLRFPTAAAFATALRGWLEQLSRRRMLPPSPLTQRLRDGLLTKRAEHAQQQQAAERRAEAIRRGIRPIALTIEAAAIEAFRELHDAISDLLPFELDVSELGPSDSPEDERGVQASTRICALVHTKMDRSINFSRAHRDVDVWKVAIKQVPAYGALIHDGRLQFPAWILWTTGSQSPNEIVKALIYGLRKDPVDPESETTLVALQGAHSRALDQPAMVKNYLIEVLATVLNLHDAM